MRRYQRSKMPARGTHKLLTFLWGEMNAQQVSQEDVAERAGVSSSAMRKWRNGSRKPNLIDLEAIFNVLGYQITVREI